MSYAACSGTGGTQWPGRERPRVARGGHEGTGPGQPSGHLGHHLLPRRRVPSLGVAGQRRLGGHPQERRRALHPEPSCRLSLFVDEDGELAGQGPDDQAQVEQGL